MMTVAKIIACILIVSHLMNSSVAAPLADNQLQQQQQSQQSGSQEKQNRKNNDHRKMGFTKEDVQMWKNPCNADGEIESNISAVDPSASYINIKMLVSDIDFELKVNDKINTTNYEAWDRFNAQYYEFLPKKPTGNHRQWHFDMQKYVASFILLHKNQEIDDALHNNNTMSQELWRILQDARKMLCEIEHFVNATSSQKIGENDWIKKKEMQKIIKFQNLTAMFLHRTYVKGRFQDYIHKLFKRIEQQSKKNFVEKQVTYPKLKSFRKNKRQGTKKARKGNRRNQNGRKMEQQQYELTPTKRTHIVRTSKQPTVPRVTKNKNVRRRQRTRTTTTLSTTVAPA